MKCDYCAGEDHLLSACNVKARERNVDLGMGCLFAALMIPFYAIGWLVGIFSSGFLAGFRESKDLWLGTWKLIRGKKDKEPEDGASL